MSRSWAIDDKYLTFVVRECAVGARITILPSTPANGEKITGTFVIERAAALELAEVLGSLEEVDAG